MNLTRGQLDRINRLGEEWSLLWDKRRRLWIAAEDAEDGDQIEEADLDVLLDPGDTVTLVIPGYATFVENPVLERVKEPGRAKSPA